MCTARNQARYVCDVSHQQSVDLASDLGEGWEINDPRDGRAAAEDDLWLLPPGEVVHLIKVQHAVVGAYSVLNGLEPLAGDRHRPAVGQVPAHGKGHAHDLVARLQEREVDSNVRGRARVGLDIGMINAKQV